MPTNRIKVEYENGAVTCTIWDGAGVPYDCSAIFEELQDRTAKTRETCRLSLRADNLQTNMNFAAVKKDLTFDVEADVVQQILQMNG